MAELVWWRGDRVFLDVGTSAAFPPIPGLEVAGPLTHIEALELGYVPSHLLVLGGGFVGLELAQAYRRFGSRVTVIQRGIRLMHGEDPDVAAEMQRVLIDEGIRVLVVEQFSTALGIVEVMIAPLIAARHWSAKASAVGSAMAVAMFLTTLSFLFTTPGWEPSLGGFPALSGAVGQFLLKDLVLLGASICTLGDAWSHQSDVARENLRP